MAEQTLNNPLSGSEVIEAILDKIRLKMQSDCFLNANSAYDWFSAEVEIHLDMHDAGAHIKVDHKVIKAHGSQPADDLQHVEADFYIDPAPPNEVRVDTGQAVPTLTRDPESGKDVVKGVRYARKDAKKAAGRVVAMLLLCAGLAHGQAKKSVTPPPAPVIPAPQFEASESIALVALSNRRRDIDKQNSEWLDAMRQMEADIARHHPGYHFDETKGQLEKDAPTKK